MAASALVPGSKEALSISAGVQKRFHVSDIQTSIHGASWSIPGRQISVAMRLDGDTLLIDFTAASAGEFAWPLIPTQASTKNFILPLGEGVCAPAHDAGWSAYLAKEGGLSTTERLSMPFWGVDKGSHVLTYLLTNPFNNELTFALEPGGLGASFSHSFTKNWKVKTYGFRISLDPPSPIAPALRYRSYLKQTGQFVSLKEKIRKTPDAAKLLGASHIYLWGDGASPKMLDKLQANGFERLWLGSPDWKGLRDNPQTVRKAKALGYLIGPYDSYDSVHSPDAKPDDTWETAQFDQKLYDTGGIVLANGKKKSGFEGKGYYLNEQAVEPYMKERVNRLTKEFDCNSWFIDCDAAGEFYEDYSPEHPANQQQEMQARLRRMAWIRDAHHLVIGSEGGTAYAASTIHFAHGTMPQLFGWDDPDLHNKTSPYFLGAYWPADAPAIFFKPVPLKPVYYRYLFDPAYRLPLFQAAFHDSVIATHHWSLPTLKFSDQAVERSLLEQLYNVPPLYHLNLAEFAKHGAWMKAENSFFSPLHREIGLLPLTGFAWLTPDRKVQRTTFGSDVEVVTNFGPKPFVYEGRPVPTKSVLALNLSTGKSTLFQPQAP